MRKNTAGQVIGAQMVSAADGSAFTGAVTCYVAGDGGTQAAGSVGSGACAHEGNGFHTYAPDQAETNYDHVAFTFTGTGAVPVTVQVYTRDAATMPVNVVQISGDATAADNAEAFFDGTGYAGTNNVIPTVTTLTNKTGFSLSASQAFDLTGNITGNLSGSVGSVAGSVGSVTAGVTVATNGDKTGYALAVTPPTSAQIVAAILAGTPTPRDVSAVTAPTVADCLVAAFVEAVCDETIVGTTYTKLQPDDSATFVATTLDDAAAPTSRTRA